MTSCDADLSGVLAHSKQTDNLQYGREIWNKDEFYEGGLFRNTLHGQGTWKRNGSGVHEGGFYSNYKEGYALLSFPDNSYFEGLFVRNRPFGPGILTHSNGRQDAGFWLGKKMVRLSRTIDYIIPRLAPTSAAKIKLLQFRRLISLNEDDLESATEILKKYECGLESPYSSLTNDPRSIFFEKSAFEKTYFMNVNKTHQKFLVDSQEWEQEEEQEEDENSLKVPSHCLCPDKEFVMNYETNAVDICNENLLKSESQMGLLTYYTKYGTLEGLGTLRSEKWEEPEGTDAEEDKLEEKPLPLKIVAWNRTEICVEMLKQIFRHRAFEEKLNFKIAKLMLGVRTEFRKTGEKEKHCLHFLKMCSLGPLKAVKEFLYNYDISETLMDARGNNSLMFATATDQHDIMDLLLDFGVDVNSFNDESLTPLNLCLLRRLALTYGISNWESAFLPTEVNKTLDEDPGTEEWRNGESIQSLDRIFGDGTSDDSINFTSDALPGRCISGEVNDPSDWSALTMLKAESLSSFLSEGKNLNRGSSTTVSPNSKIITSSYKRLEYEKNMKKSTRDKYLFDLGPQKRPTSDTSKKPIGNDTQETEGELEDPELTKKIEEIDRTIGKLLQRGADPNISEVPKPSIHLAVFTQNVNLVHALLLYGASPDSQLYPNEGLLTPLHVIALIKPAPVFVEICELLLNFGANVEEETLPEFSIYEEEKDFLDPEHGRTPLQLLCMRPDLEYSDPDGHLINIALLLVKVSNKKRRYNGHSFLTLTMMAGNTNLLKAFLEAKVFNPNKGLKIGTALHVLVSTPFQMKTPYDMTINMCDLLLEGGANPLKKLDGPEDVMGTCVDYGYREIEKEKNKQTRKPSTGKKPEGKSEKKGEKGVRDVLKDHMRVLEYIQDQIRENEERFKKMLTHEQSRGGRETRRSKGQSMTGSKVHIRTSTNLANKEDSKRFDGSYVKFSENKDVKPSTNDQILSHKVVKSTNENESDKGNNNEKRVDKEKASEMGVRRGGNKEKFGEKGVIKGDDEEKESEKEARKGGNKEKANEKRAIKGDDKEKAIEKEARKGGNKEKSGEKGVIKKDDKEKASEKEARKGGNKEKSGERGVIKGDDKEKATEKEARKGGNKEKASEKRVIKGDDKEKATEKEARKGGNKEKSGEKGVIKGGDKHKDNEKWKSKNQRLLLEEIEAKGKHSKDSDKLKKAKKMEPEDKEIQKEKRDAVREEKKKVSEINKIYDSKKDILKPWKSRSTKQISETFPEKLRKSLLEMFGNCSNVDVNKFLLPYVVLRDGDLYYRFQGNTTKKKEQYSLI